MAFLRDRLSKRGFQVLTVPENATHFLTNSEGFQPEWAGTDSQVAMQRIFMEYQISQEEAFKSFAKLHPSKRSILLLDCCTLNSKVYLSDEQWKKVLSLPGHAALTEQQLFSRYDLVIHMVSCAFEGLYEWGPGSNNPGRYHSPEQAREADKRSLDVFANHPQVRVVPHFPSFDGKMNQVLHFLNDALHIDGLTGKRHRQQVRIKDFEALSEIAGHANTTSFLVTSTFLDDQMEKSVRRRVTISNKVWIENFKKLTSTSPLSRTESFDDIEALRDGHDVIYEQRSHVYVRVSSGSDEQSSYLTRRLIKAEDYYTAESVASEKKSTVKFVLGFVTGNQYYELFFFSCYKEPILDMNDDSQCLPDWLELAESSCQVAESQKDQQVEEKSDGLASAATSKDAASMQETPTPARAGSRFEQPTAKRMRVLTRYSTEAAACEVPLS